MGNRDGYDEPWVPVDNRAIIRVVNSGHRFFFFLVSLPPFSSFAKVPMAHDLLLHMFVQNR